MMMNSKNLWYAKTWGKLFLVWWNKNSIIRLELSDKIQLEKYRYLVHKKNFISNNCWTLKGKEDFIAMHQLAVKKKPGSISLDESADSASSLI